jgi:succinate-semialdehyde dehydrogenase/glutarate-semialdehyde dehydrogenase
MSTLASAPTTPKSASELQSFDPATGELVGSVPTTPVETDPALRASAKAAQRSWAGMTLEQRAALLRPAADRLKTRVEAIALLITREMGKPIADARNEVNACAGGFNEALDECIEALAPETREDAKTRSTLVFDALGVCAAITPWNFPVMMPQDCVLPALMAGNAVIVKPSEETPLCAFEWLKCVAQGLPQDVLQIVFGDEAQGKALVASDVDLIAFTGSRAAGKHILQAAGGAMKRVILELGGKDR